MRKFKTQNANNHLTIIKKIINIQILSNLSKYYL